MSTRPLPSFRRPSIKHFNVSIDSPTLARIDAYAEHFEARRSEMINHLLERGLDDLDQALAEADAQDAAAAAEGLCEPPQPKKPRARAKAVVLQAPQVAPAVNESSETDSFADLLAGLDA